MKEEDLWLPTFTPEEYFRYSRAVGDVRINLVQMIWYKTDHSYILDLIAADPETFAGTGVVDLDDPAPDRTMIELSKKGCRAFREPPSEFDHPAFEKLFSTGADHGLALSFNMGVDRLPALDRLCTRYPETPVILDHVCHVGIREADYSEEDLEALLRFARHRQVMVKIGPLQALCSRSAPYFDVAAPDSARRRGLRRRPLHVGERQRGADHHAGSGDRLPGRGRPDPRPRGLSQPGREGGDPLGYRGKLLLWRAGLRAAEARSREAIMYTETMPRNPLLSGVTDPDAERVLDGSSSDLARATRPGFLGNRHSPVEWSAGDWSDMEAARDDLLDLAAVEEQFDRGEFLRDGYAVFEGVIRPRAREKWLAALERGQQLNDSSAPGRLVRHRLARTRPPAARMKIFPPGISGRPSAAASRCRRGPTRPGSAP